MADFLYEITQGAAQMTAVPLSHSLQSFKIFFCFAVEHGEEKTNFLKTLQN